MFEQTIRRVCRSPCLLKNNILYYNIIRTKGGPSDFFPTTSTSTKLVALQNWVTQLTRQADENQHFRHHMRVVCVTRN
jgi:hypothetical protein